MKKPTYRDYIRTLACPIKGTIDSDPHHIKGYGWLTGNAGALKNSDLCCIPLNHEIHNELHNIGWESWERKYNVSQLHLMIVTILSAERDGVITINREVIKKLL